MNTAASQPALHYRFSSVLICPLGDATFKCPHTSIFSSVVGFSCSFLQTSVAFSRAIYNPSGRSLCSPFQQWILHYNTVQDRVGSWPWGASVFVVSRIKSRWWSMVPLGSVRWSLQRASLQPAFPQRQQEPSNHRSLSWELNTFLLPTGCCHDTDREQQLPLEEEEGWSFQVPVAHPWLLLCFHPPASTAQPCVRLCVGGQLFYSLSFSRSSLAPPGADAWQHVHHCCCLQKAACGPV